MTRPVFLYFDPHPAHEAMVGGVEAELIESEKGGVVSRIQAARNLDLGDRPLIIEGGQPLFQAAWMKKFNNCGPLIHLAADETLMNIFNPLAHYGASDRMAHFWAHRYVDAVLAVSPRLTSEARALGTSVVRTIFPFTENWKYNSLGDVDPDLSSNRILAVGKHKPANNFESLEYIAQSVGYDVSFDVVGPDTHLLDSTNVTGHGFVEQNQFIEFFEKNSGFILPAYSQAFPVSVLEALRAGLPPIITTEVGTQSAIQKIDPHLVAGTSVESLSRVVEWYLERPISTKNALSRSCRELGRCFAPERGVETFNTAYKQVLNEIQ